MSDLLSIIDKVNRFNETNPSYYIAYGGDGTLLKAAHEHSDKILIPIRNYGWCSAHDSEVYIDMLFKNNFTEYAKLFSFKRLSYTLANNGNKVETSPLAMSEIVIRNHDPRQALRFNVYVNQSLYLENVMCDGVIVSTPFGSHGYFKSVTRTLFYDGIGLAFIAPTYGINNLILKSTDSILLQPLRSMTVDFVSDTQFETKVISDNYQIRIKYEDNDVKVVGYNTFMCQECRRNRNSTIINDQYFIN